MIKYISIFLLIFSVASGQVTVVEDSLFTESLNAFSRYSIVLPDGYSKGHERYPVVYLLHGYGGDYTNWITLTNLVRYARNYKFILVTPDGKNSWYANAVSVKNANYEDFIVKDLIAHIDKKYRTVQSKFSRSITGLSMGGYGAVKLALKYPGKFFFAGGISPAIQAPFGLEDTAYVLRRSKGSIQSQNDAFGPVRSEQWNSNDVFRLAEKVTANSAPYIYLSVGSQDGLTEIIDLTHAFTATLRKQSIPFEMHETAGAHDWKFWDKEIEIVLQRIQEISSKKR
jgi:S-formylglutathione hydrolase FrmB